MSDFDYYCEDKTWYTPDDWAVSPDEDIINGYAAVARRNVLVATKGATWHLKFTAELRELENLIGQAGHADFTAIHEDHWDDYVIQYVDDVCGDISMLESFIDWKGLSRHIAQDYTEIEYAGKTFLVR